MEIFKLIQKLENDIPTKLSRLLILIYELSGKNQTKCISNVSKLAKFDFLMTSPLMLKRVVAKQPRSVNKLALSTYDTNSIESQNYFYKYNPWSTNYRSLLNILISKDLISVEINKLSYDIKITASGIVVVSTLYKQNCFQEYQVRAKLINTNLGSYSNEYLRDYFQEKFPELSNLNQDDYEDPF